MPESLIDGTGSGNLARINSEGRLLVDISGATINIGSVSANVGSIYVQSGTIHLDQTPDLITANPEINLIWLSSGTSTGTTGSEIGSVIKYIGAGSYVSVLSYTNGNLTNVGSFV